MALSEMALPVVFSHCLEVSLVRSCEAKSVEFGVLQFVGDCGVKCGCLHCTLPGSASALWEDVLPASSSRRNGDRQVRCTVNIVWLVVSLRQYLQLGYFLLEHTLIHGILVEFLFQIWLIYHLINGGPGRAHVEQSFPHWARIAIILFIAEDREVSSCGHILRLRYLALVAFLPSHSRRKNNLFLWLITVTGFHTHVVLIRLVSRILQQVSLLTEACLLIILEHCMHELTHDCSLLLLNLLHLDLEFGIGVLKRINLFFEGMRKFHELLLLTKIQLMGEVGLILTLAQLLLELHALFTIYPFLICLKLILQFEPLILLVDFKELHP